MTGEGSPKDREEELEREAEDLARRQYRAGASMAMRFDSWESLDAGQREFLLRAARYEVRKRRGRATD